MAFHRFAGALAKKAFKVSFANTLLPKLDQRITRHDVRCAHTQVKKLAPDDHRLIWKLQRLCSICLIIALPIDVMYPCLLFDNLFVLLMALHSFWGVNDTIADYCRPILFGPYFRKAWHAIWYITWTVGFSGLLYLNFMDIGFGRALYKIWRMEPKD